MLNYIALAFIKYLHERPVEGERKQLPEDRYARSPGARLTKVLGVHWGWILALILVCWWLIFILIRQSRDMRLQSLVRE